MTDGAQAWSNRIKNREKVLNSLRDIPILLSVALEKWNSFKTDKQLIQAVRQLYKNAMDTIRTLIDILFYKSSGTSRTWRFVSHAKYLVPVNLDEGKIDQVLETLNVSKRNMDTYVDILDRRRDAETHSNTKLTAVRAITTHKTVEDTKRLVTSVAAEVSAGNDTMRTHHQETTTKIGDIETKVQELGSTQAYLTKLLEGYAYIPKMMEQMGLTELMRTSLYLLNTEQIYKKSTSAFEFPMYFPFCCPPFFFWGGG